MSKMVYGTFFLKRTLFLGLLILVFKGLELISDYFVGNNDGEFLIARYLLFLAIGSYFLYLSLKLNSAFESKLAIILASFVLIITSVEFLFFILVNMIMPSPEYTRDQYTVSSSNRFSLYDEEGGYLATPNGKTTEVLYSNGTEISRSEYHIDSLSRRITPQYFENATGKSYACFFGCSFTFGLSVNDEQTLPACFARIDTNFRSYNYGMNGYGTQHILSRLKNLDKSEIAENTGIFVYVYIDEHIRRVIGDQFFMETNVWAEDSPFYKLQGDKIKLEGTFGKDRKVKDCWYRLLNKSYTLRKFNIKFPIFNRDEYCLLTGKLIEACYSEYRRKFNHDNFFVLIFPGQSTEIVSSIKEKKIKVIDFSNLFDLTETRFHNPGDYHPSPLTYELVARELHKEIRANYWNDLVND